MIHYPYRKWQPLHTLIEATVIGLVMGIAWQLAWQVAGSRSILVSCFGFFFLVQQALGFMRQMKGWPCTRYSIGEANVLATFLGLGLLQPLTLSRIFVILMGVMLFLIYLSTIRRIQRFSDEYEKRVSSPMDCH